MEEQQASRPNASDRLEREIRTQEDKLFDDLEELAQSEPDPLAPIAEQVAHTIAAGRARSEAERVAELHKKRQEK